MKRKGIVAGVVLLMAVALMPGKVWAETTQDKVILDPIHREQSDTNTSLHGTQNTDASKLTKLHVTGNYNYKMAFQVLELVNKEREAKNLTPLKMDKDLLDAAMVRACETNLYFSHTRPDGTDYYTANDKISGENIASGNTTAAATMEQWMNSAGHKANILDESWQSIGIGCYYQDGYWTWVQCFGYDKADEAESRTDKEYHAQIVSMLTDKVALEVYVADKQMEQGKSQICRTYAVNPEFDKCKTALDAGGVTYQTSDSGVIAVSGNKLTAQGGGTANITAEYVNVTSAAVEITVNSGNGWQKNDYGYWYRNEDGSWPSNQWSQINGKWYYFNGSGYMTTGWQKVSGKWYYMDNNGGMTTGWQKVSGKWYYMDSNGGMTTGWQKVSGKWYYMDGSGAMQENRWIGDYYVTGSGAMATSTWIGQYYVGADGKYIKGYKESKWVKDSKGWWYQNNDGSWPANKWQKINGKWYYFNGAGYMVTGWQKISGKWYYMNVSGDMAADMWIGKYYVNASGEWTKTK